MTRKLVVAIDPGEAKLGLASGDKDTKKTDMYLCDLRQIPNPAKKKKVVKVVKRAKRAPFRKMVDSRYLPDLISKFVDRIDFLLKDAIVCLIEEQKVSVPRTKKIAKLLYETIKAKYPGLLVGFLDPVLVRTFYNIRAFSKDYPGLDDDQMRLIRKAKSWQETHHIPQQYREMVEKAFTVDGKKGPEFCVDPIEAALMVAYFMEHPDCLTVPRPVKKNPTAPVNSEFLIRCVSGIPLYTPATR